MKISFIIPPSGPYTENKNWLWWVWNELNKIDGNEVLLNQCDSDCDFIVCMTISQVNILDDFSKKYPHIPVITYNWDWLSFIDKTEYPWPLFVEYMKKSVDIWTPSQYMVKKMKAEIGLDHYVIEACSVVEECEDMHLVEDKGYVVQASRRDERYKNFSMFEKACEELNIPYISCHPKKYNRKEYLKILSGCKILVVATNEDANAALSSIEAAYYKKILLLSDIEPHKECWKDTAIYFETDDYDDFKYKLNKLYTGELKIDTDKAHKRAMDLFTSTAMADAINKRLKELL